MDYIFSKSCKCSGLLGTPAHPNSQMYSLCAKVFGPPPSLTARMVLQAPLAAHNTLLNTHGTGADPAAVALDAVGVVLGLLPARLAPLALPAQQSRHRGDGLDKDIALALARDVTLLDAVECALVHDDDTGAADDLEVERLDKLAGLEHGFARFEDDVLGLHGRNLAVDAQPTERHAAFPTD